MSQTPDILAANLADTVRRVRDSLSLPAVGMIPADRHGEYMRALSAAILASPGDYSAQAVSNARRYLETPDQAPIAPFTFGEGVNVFTGEFIRQAGNVAGGAADVGRGVVNAAALSRWLIPVALGAAVLVLLIRLSGGPPFPPPRHV